MSLTIASHEKEWAQPYLKNILKEISESNGSVKEIQRNETMIKVMSKIANFLRFDLISKNEVVTYNIPNHLDKDIFSLF